MIELDITIEDFATTEGLEIMLRDDTGTQVDYALLGPFFGRFTDEAEWTGSGYNFPTATGAMRTTLTDNNDASDWGELTMKSLCMLNPGQPDFPPTASPTVAPTEPSSNHVASNDTVTDNTSDNLTTNYTITNYTPYDLTANYAITYGTTSIYVASNDTVTDNTSDNLTTNYTITN
eukprot:CAMPEP_0168534100 /NCGR_PEP_ID=MMETSP0405-20121227/17624_1 /TAXON_ID=498012 /ORGANISM="Trichosphaerium sp, Strain Am-I-7 wt" /LENGTH=175 /DNA_ID=CAMNT_0008560593 /DNA_START=309 /DNA_END=832 /DNA_ORIENTATION=-